jgi:hypothetical protein
VLQLCVLKGKVCRSLCFWYHFFWVVLLLITFITALGSSKTVFFDVF